MEAGYYSPSKPFYWRTYNNELDNESGWATDDSYSGIYSLKIVNTTGVSAGWTGNAIPVNGYPDNCFTFEGMSKAQDVEAGALYTLDFKITFEDGSYIWYYPQELRFSTDGEGWQHVNLLVDPVREPEKFVKFKQKVISIKPYCLLYRKSGTVWFDDIYVRMKKPTQ
jgi:hypothetical protein